MKTDTPTTKPETPAGLSSSVLFAERPEWKVHTSNLLSEIVKHSGQDMYRIPLSILGQLLAAVGERAAELNDPKLNALMCRLTIYTIADPTSPDYDLEAVRTVMSLANS
jgi:hypothetical protein